MSLTMLGSSEHPGAAEATTTHPQPPIGASLSVPTAAPGTVSAPPVPPAVHPYAPRRWWRDVAGLCAYASMIVVVALWLAHGGIASLTGGAGILTGLGRLTGLVAADLLLIQVLLMARIPWVERSYGQDELTRRHRLVGFTSFNLVLAHIALIILGYAASARTGLLTQAWDLITNYPGMLLATAGFALLVMVVVTSVRAARRRLRYESWHLLHLYAYLGVGLSIPHELWTGADFTSTAWARVYWWTVYAAAAGSIIVFRLGLPALRTWRHSLVVDRVVAEAPAVVSLHLRGQAIERMHASAGQFFIWRFMTGPGWSRGHPYSLSAPPHPRWLRITVKDLGDGSRELARVRPGSRVLIEGPYGRLTAAVRQRRRLTMMASGIGITPIRALLEELDYSPGEATLVYRASTEEDLIFRYELDMLAAKRGVRVIYLPGHRSPDRSSWLPERFSHLLDDDALRQIVPDIADHDVFICGPDAWMDAVRDAALLAGVPSEQLHLERFRW
ncbi:ferric reductase-like transmembrane domain-containing protein [Frankia sp. CiP3]|uniref:ferredoxin reductase family protein n=1 Tax=Frankia sp. CiP3 TaxID=2880971 RepID=UPI001EF55195|nr:ferredoxin reductase family protein [Frankia sp. CiP3]